MSLLLAALSLLIDFMGLAIFYHENGHKNQSDAPIVPRFNAMIARSLAQFNPL
jgi:hypothetical protein